MTDENQAAPWSLAPRTHNMLSYAVTALIMVAMSDWGRPWVTLASGLWVLHFVRRTAESAWVHRYSGRRVPPGDWAIEYVYYWGFAFWIASGLNDAEFGSTPVSLLYVGVSVFALGELGNAWAHLRLRALRDRAGETTRTIPEGGLFRWVSCPHYLFEITSWVGFAAVSRTWGSIAFLVVGAGILGTYAWQRHAAYIQEFDGIDGRGLYPSRRRALVPFVF